MSELEDRFVEILVESGALLTGDFQLKSGKSSKFFIDFGRVPDGLHLEREDVRIVVELWWRPPLDFDSQTVTVCDTSV
jgi:orotate phosphoribosyltransferase